MSKDSSAEKSPAPGAKPADKQGSFLSALSLPWSTQRGKAKPFSQGVPPGGEKGASIPLKNSFDALGNNDDLDNCGKDSAKFGAQAGELFGKTDDTAAASQLLQLKEPGKSYLESPKRPSSPSYASVASGFASPASSFYMPPSSASPSKKAFAILGEDPIDMDSLEFNHDGDKETAQEVSKPLEDGSANGDPELDKAWNEVSKQGDEDFKEVLQQVQRNSGDTGGKGSSDTGNGFPPSTMGADTKTGVEAGESTVELTTEESVAAAANTSKALNGGKSDGALETSKGGKSEEEMAVDSNETSAESMDDKTSTENSTRKEDETDVEKNDDDFGGGEDEETDEPKTSTAATKGDHDA
ncbi:MAG: hypothetical protein SGARI_004125, partial [Bacillariaceae sp.]